MNIVRFHQKEHIDFVKAWLLRRKLSISLADNLPRLGWIAFEDEPVGCIFVREVEGSMGLVDGLITDLSIHPYKRHRAIEALVKHMIQECRGRFFYLMAYSVDAGTLKRSLRHGFKELQHKVITHDLA